MDKQKKLIKKNNFPQKICLRLVGTSLIRKNASVPSIWVFWPISPIVSQKSQERGIIMDVQKRKGKNTKLGKTQAKKSLMFLMIGLVVKSQPSSRKDQLRKERKTKIITPNIKYDNKETQVIGLRKILFKK